MGLVEATAIIIVLSVTVAGAGVLAVFAVGFTAGRSRGCGWEHLLGRMLRLTLAVTAIAVVAQVVVIVAGVVLA